MWLMLSFMVVLLPNLSSDAKMLEVRGFATAEAAQKAGDKIRLEGPRDPRCHIHYGADTSIWLSDHWKETKTPILQAPRTSYWDPILATSQSTVDCSIWQRPIVLDVGDAK